MRTAATVATTVVLALACLVCADAGANDSPTAVAPRVDSPRVDSIVLRDEGRSRDIPVQMHFPPQPSRCETPRRCPVAIISHGYGISNTEYSFLAEPLSRMGFLVVSVQHELPADPPLPTSGNLYASRLPVWQRGQENLLFVREALSKNWPAYRWDQAVLIGHSNGGDISVWAATHSAQPFAAVITLDHRRVPLPCKAGLRVLSLRSSDMPPIAGVVPAADRWSQCSTHIVQLHDAPHSELTDHGSAAIKEQIVAAVTSFLRRPDETGAAPGRSR